MILAGESSLDSSRALKKGKKRKRSEHRRGAESEKINGTWPGANVVDDDWLVGEDIFVFGGHSARAARIGCGCARDIGGLRSIAEMRWTRKRELRRVGAAGAKPGANTTIAGATHRFLANDIDHDRVPSSEDLQLFPLVDLDMSRAGQIPRCRSHLILMLTQEWL
jgi:hypothetical protein